MPPTDRDAALLMELIDVVKQKLDEIVEHAERIIAAAQCNGANDAS